MPKKPAWALAGIRKKDLRKLAPHKGGQTQPNLMMVPLVGTVLGRGIPGRKGLVTH